MLSVHERCFLIELFLQEVISSQFFASNVDNVELRRKFGAMISSAFLDGSSSFSCMSSGITALPPLKAAPVVKARPDANVRRRV